MIPNEKTTTTTNKPPYGLRKGIEAVLEAVAVEAYLRDRGVKVRNGRAPCILHGGDNPQSFAVYPNERRWYCFRCNEGGDVINLCQAVEGGELWECVRALATRYAVELPERPERWRKRQNTKAAMREELYRGITKVYQRRLYRIFRDQGAHPEDDAALWEALYPAARVAARERVYG